MLCRACKGTEIWDPDWLITTLRPPASGGLVWIPGALTRMWWPPAEDTAALTRTGRVLTFYVQGSLNLLIDNLWDPCYTWHKILSTTKLDITRLFSKKKLTKELTSLHTLKSMQRHRNLRSWLVNDDITSPSKRWPGLDPRGANPDVMTPGRGHSSINKDGSGIDLLTNLLTSR